MHLVDDTMRRPPAHPLTQRPELRPDPRRHA
jgi:hypothetical protein